MKKKTRRIIMTVMMTGLIVGLSSMTGLSGKKAKAAQPIIKSGVYEYQINDEAKKTATLRKITEYGEEVIIPETIDGYTIERIGAPKGEAYGKISDRLYGLLYEQICVFQKNEDKVKKLVIPNTVKLIDHYAFYNMPALTELVLPDGLTRICEENFNNATELKKIEFPAGLKVELDAFRGVVFDKVVLNGSFENGASRMNGDGEDSAYGSFGASAKNILITKKNEAKITVIYPKASGVSANQNITIGKNVRDVVLQGSFDEVNLKSSKTKLTKCDYSVGDETAYTHLDKINVTVKKGKKNASFVYVSDGVTYKIDSKNTLVKIKKKKTAFKNPVKFTLKYADETKKISLKKRTVKMYGDRDSIYFLKIKAKAKKLVITNTKKEVKPTTQTNYPIPTVNWDAPGAAAVLKETSNDINTFACKIYSGLGNASENVLLSPLGLYSSLAPVSSCSGDGLYNEIGNAFGNKVPVRTAEFKRYFNGKMDEDVTVTSNNTYVFDKAARKSDYFDNFKTLTDSFAGNITEKQGIDKNAIDIISETGFSGVWATGFESVAKESFNGASGKTDVDMMTMSEPGFKYYENDTFTGIELPYASGKYVMDIVMAKEDSQNTGEAFRALSADERISLISDISAAKMTDLKTVKLPKFDMNVRISESVPKVFAEAGITSLFDKEKADLTYIVKGSYVGSYISNAGITVSEAGKMLPKPVPGAGERFIEFVADRPFVFVVRDTVSDIIILIGEINVL